MTPHIPAERTLAHKEEILRRVLDEQDGRTGRRGRFVPIVAAAAVAVLATATITVVNSRDTAGDTPAAGPSDTASIAAQQPVVGPGDVKINLGPVPAAEAEVLGDRCLQAVGSRSGGTLDSATGIRSWTDARIWHRVVVKDAEGNTFGCFGSRPPSSPAKSQVFANPTQLTGDSVGGTPDPGPVDDEHPAAPRGGPANLGAVGWIDFAGNDNLLTAEYWWQVDPRVAAVRQRWVLPGRTGPWYVAEAIGGFVLMKSWDEPAGVKIGDKVRIETQVLDRTGQLLDAPTDVIVNTGQLRPSTGTTRVDAATVVAMPEGFPGGELKFPVVVDR